MQVCSRLLIAHIALSHAHRDAWVCPRAGQRVRPARCQAQPDVPLRARLYLPARIRPESLLGSRAGRQGALAERDLPRGRPHAHPPRNQEAALALPPPRPTPAPARPIAPGRRKADPALLGAAAGALCGDGLLDVCGDERGARFAVHALLLHAGLGLVRPADADLCACPARGRSWHPSERLAHAKRDDRCPPAPRR